MMHKGGMRPIYAVVLIAIAAAVAVPAVADDTSEMWRTAEAYIACGRDYVKAAIIPTVEGAKSACARELDAYGLAMRTLAINTQIAEGNAGLPPCSRSAARGDRQACLHRPGRTACAVGGLAWPSHP